MAKKSLLELAPKDAQLGTGLVIIENGRLLFVVPKGDRWERDETNLRTTFRITGVGGPLEIGEDFASCARRECIEEIGSRVSLVSANKTLFVDYDNSVRRLELSEEMRPAIVFRRVFLKGPESFQLFVAVYLGRLVDKHFPVENPATLALTLESLRKLSSSPLRLSTLLRDGAHLVEKEPLPRNCHVGLFGTPEILVAINRSRFSLTALLQNK